MQQAIGEIRDPRDPDPVPSSKAATAFGLAIVGVVMAPFIGGVVPAVMALRLAGEAESEILASKGFLTGSVKVRRVRFLARLALLIALTMVLLGVVVWVAMRVGGSPGGETDFPSNVD